MPRARRWVRYSCVLSLALVSAWLAGGIIILIELPKERNPRVFVAGAFTFALLIRLNLYPTGVEGGA